MANNVINKLITYLMVGVFNTVVDFAVFIFLTEKLEYDPVLANVISYSIGIGMSFIMNRRFTFRAQSYHLAPQYQFLRFLTVSLLSLVLSTLLVSLFAQAMTPRLAKILSAPFVVMWGFFAARAFVFA
jgi:putative flippase GtrA